MIDIFEVLNGNIEQFFFVLSGSGSPSFHAGGRSVPSPPYGAPPPPPTSAPPLPPTSSPPSNRNGFPIEAWDREVCNYSLCLHISIDYVHEQYFYSSAYNLLNSKPLDC